MRLGYGTGRPSMLMATACIIVRPMPETKTSIVDLNLAGECLWCSHSTESCGHKAKAPILLTMRCLHCKTARGPRGCVCMPLVAFVFRNVQNT